MGQFQNLRPGQNFGQKRGLAMPIGQSHVLEYAYNQVQDAGTLKSKLIVYKQVVIFCEPVSTQQRKLAFNELKEITVELACKNI